MAFRGGDEVGRREGVIGVGLSEGDIRSLIAELKML